MTEQDWILVVDDDDDTREMVTLLLGLEGYRLVGASDGLDGLEQIRSRGRPALILLDIRMPRMNGADFAHALRSDPKLAQIPIIVLTGDATTVDGERFHALDWIIKPIDLERLLEVVASAVHPHPPAPPAARAAP